MSFAKSQLGSGASVWPAWQCPVTLLADDIGLSKAISAGLVVSKLICPSHHAVVGGRPQCPMQPSIRTSRREETPQALFYDICSRSAAHSEESAGCGFACAG